MAEDLRQPAGMRPCGGCFVCAGRVAGSGVEDLECSSPIPVDAQGRDLNEVDLLRWELAKAREERDLAITHDRQPYPTAWAYEQACKALHQQRERAETAEQEAARLRALFLERCGAIERVRHVCQKAKAKKDAPGMWLVADQVLAALPERTENA